MKYKDYLKSLNFSNQNDRDIIFNNIIIANDLLRYSLFPSEKINEFPLSFYKNQSFALNILNYYHPPIDKIPEDFFKDPIFVLKIAENSPYNLKYVPQQYITEQILEWYIYSQNNKIDYLKYIPVEKLSKNLIYSIIDKDPSNFVNIDSSKLNKDFYLSLNKNDLSKIYQHLPLEFKKDIDILKIVIEQNPSLYSLSDSSLQTPEIFKELIEINPDIYSYSKFNIRDDFSLSILVINKKPELLNSIKNLGNDLEFFIACHHNLQEKISPYLKNFSTNIFSDKGCVNLILDTLISNRLIHLLQEPVLSDKEIMFSAISKNPENYQYIGDKLLYDIDFFNKLQFFYKEQSFQEPLKYIWLDSFKDLISNIPNETLENIDFFINLFDNNQDIFMQSIFPIISHNNSNNTYIKEILNNNLNSFDNIKLFLNRYKHQRDLELTIKNMNSNKKDFFSKKI